MTLRSGQKAALTGLAIWGLLEWWSCTDGQCISQGIWAWGAPSLTAATVTSLVVGIGLGILAVHLIYPIWVRRRRRP